MSVQKALISGEILDEFMTHNQLIIKILGAAGLEPLRPRPGDLQRLEIQCLTMQINAYQANFKHIALKK
jgi:hypothetical protein